jgi:hypothetical protein
MFRFNIRDVLWLMAVVALGLAWWAESRRTAAMRAERDEMEARWQDASKKWVELYNMGPPPWPHISGGLGGGAAPARQPVNEPASP